MNEAIYANQMQIFGVDSFSSNTVILQTNSRPVGDRLAFACTAPATTEWPSAFHTDGLRAGAMGMNSIHQ